MVLLQSFRHVAKSFGCPVSMCPVELEQGGPTLPSCLSSPSTNKCHVPGLFAARFFPFLYFSFVILLFTVSIERSDRVLSSVLKCKKAVLCLLEKMCVLDELHIGVSYRAEPIT